MGVEVFYSNPFAQKFWIEANAEINTCFETRDLFDDRSHKAHRDTWRNGATHHNDMKPLLALQTAPDRAGSRINKGMITSTISRGWRANRNESDVSINDRLLKVRAGAYQTVFNAFAKQLLLVLLMDWRFPS